MTPRLLLVLVVLAAGASCSSGGVDRDDAIARVVDEGGGRVTREQAACYVDRVLDEIGSAPLRPDAEVGPETEARLTALRVDCIGVANLGAVPSGSMPGVTGPLPGPQRRGDDAALDQLWDRCAAGFGEACDELFDRATIGSDYEEFGATCGDRTRELQCAAVYPAPGVTLPSGAQPTTTVAPAPP